MGMKKKRQRDKWRELAESESGKGGPASEPERVQEIGEVATSGGERVRVHDESHRPASGEAQTTGIDTLARNGECVSQGGKYLRRAIGRQ